MADSSAISSDLSVFRGDVTGSLGQLRKLRTVHLNSQASRDSIRELVQNWFRRVRPAVLLSGVDEQLLLSIDASMQELLRLSQGRSLRTHYVAALSDAKNVLGELEILQEVALSTASSSQADTPPWSATEEAIVATLDRLVPSAASSYRQAILDLADATRVSFRGPANELRSVLWDVLDRLAPDSEVEAVPGFKLETGRTKPTQKQKARYILKSRSVPGSARKVPETSIEILEDRVAALARATYDRSSISAHLSAARSEVVQIKMYLDSLLMELLEIR